FSSRSLLARRLQQGDAATYLWHRLGRQESSGAIPATVGRSGKARPSQDWQEAFPFPLPGRSAWYGVLASTWLDHISGHSAVHAESAERQWLSGNSYATTGRLQPVGKIRPCGQVCRTDVQ